MHVTKWGESGILCSMHLAEHYGKPAIGASEIAAIQNLDLQYTQQVLHRLRKGGIVESIRGPHGGYRLTRAPIEISLREILLAVEGATFETICDYDPIRPVAGSPSRCGNRDTCALRGVWQDLQNAINSLLEARRLSDLVTPRESLVSITNQLKQALAVTTEQSST